MEKLSTYLPFYFILMIALLPNHSFAQLKPTIQNQTVSLNPVIKLDQLDPNALISLEAVGNSELEKFGMKFYEYNLKYITAQNQTSGYFKYSAEHQCFIPVLDKNINGIKQAYASIKIGFHQNAPINIRIQRSSLENTTNLSAMLAAHFSNDFDHPPKLLIVSRKTTWPALSETIKSDMPAIFTDLFFVSEIHNLSTISPEFFNSESRAFVLLMSEKHIPIKMLDNENKLLQGLISIDLHGRQLQKLTYSTYGICWNNHQSISVDATTNLIPVYLSCLPTDVKQVTLDIIQPYPVYLTANSTSPKTFSTNSLSFDLFSEKFISLEGSITLPYTFIYLDFSDQFLKSNAIEITENIIESIKREKSTFSVFASNHLKPIILKSADFSQEAKNQYFMRLLSLAPNPPGIYQETQLIFENCLNPVHQLLNPVELIFVFTADNASFNLKLLNAIVMELPQNTSIRCTLYIPAKYAGLYKTEDMLRYRFLDKIIIDFQYFK